MITDIFDGLTVFLAVAEHRSFARAAKSLEVSPTAVSKAVRVLERRHGVVLFQRTTRSVALTEGGDALLKRLRPAAEIGDALAGLADFGHRPVGSLRLTLSRPSMKLLVEPMIGEFHRAYPEVILDISLNEGVVDLASGLYDAGIRQGESVEKDMVAVRLTPELRWCIVASPGYLTQAGKPRSPEDLHGHRCLIYRFVTSGQRHRWEFTREGSEVSMSVPGQLVVDDRMTLVRLAAAGHGLAYVAEMEAAEELASGRLVPVLQDYLTPSAGMFLYFPARTKDQPKLRAFIDMLRRKETKAG
jgi:DNA-binding transcriptional LysR family regulator